MKRVNVFQALRKSELLLNTSILVSGSALAQLIPFLLRPVLTRTPSAEMFGAYAVYGSLMGILVIISSFRYELAIILPKKDKEAANVFFLSVILSLILNVFIFLIVILWKEHIALFLNLPKEFANYLFLVPLGTFLLSSYQSINYWLIRKKQFPPVSVNKFIRRSFEGAAQVSLKFAKIPHFLIYGDIIGHIANVCSGIYQGNKSGLKLNLLSAEKIKYVFSKYIDYPKFNLLPGLMGACGTLLPAILINKFFSLENTGYLNLSTWLLSMPVALVSMSVSSVLMQRTADKFKNNVSIKKELVITLVIISVFAILETLIITLFGEELFKVVFGVQWGFSGVIAKILVWSYALNFIVNSFSSLFISMNKIKLLSFWQMLYFVSIVSLVLFRNNSFVDFIKIYVVIEVVCAVVISFLMVSIVSRYETEIKHILKQKTV